MWEKLVITRKDSLLVQQNDHEISLWSKYVLRTYNLIEGFIDIYRNKYLYNKCFLCQQRKQLSLFTHIERCCCSAGYRKICLLNFKAEVWVQRNSNLLQDFKKTIHRNGSGVDVPIIIQGFKLLSARAEYKKYQQIILTHFRPMFHLWINQVVGFY